MDGMEMTNGKAGVSAGGVVVIAAEEVRRRMNG